MGKQQKVSRRNWTGTKRPQTRFKTMVLLTALGSLTLMGCTSHSASHNYNGVALGDPAQDVTTTRSYVNDMAKRDKLPERYVSEARIRIADIEAKLARAQATKVESDADWREKQAKIQALRQEAQTLYEVAEAEARKTEQSYSAKRSQLSADAEARKRELDSTIQKNAALIEALAKERQTLKDEIISKANLDYNADKAQIAKLTNIRQTTEQESLASIEKMKESAKATRSRSQAAIEALRTEAQSLDEQTQARAAELEVQIKTVQQQTQAESDRLAVLAKSQLDSAYSSAAEKNARALALTEQASDQQYNLKVTAANNMFEQAKAENDKALAEAKNNYQRSVAELEILIAESQRITSDAESQYQGGMSELDAWFKDSLAEVDKIRISSNRKETLARQEFVKAEAQAKADAIRETAVHQQELADEQMQQIIAEAEEEAARVRTQILDQLAAQQADDSVEFPGKTGPGQELPEDLHQVPQVAQVDAVTPVIEPEHVAQFRAGLAEVMRDRSQADSQEMAIQATYDESSSKMQAVLNQQLAIAAEQNATADALQTQADAALAQAEAKAEAVLEMAQASQQKLLADADSFRSEARAEASDLMAQARAETEVATAKSNQLMHESQAIRKQGQSEIKALDTSLDSTRRRGKAEYDRLMAEASSIEQSKAALAHQIDAQIAAAERTLSAELAKLDRSIESQTTIAQVNYNQALVNADVLEQQTEVEISRARAQNELDNALAKAAIDRTMNLIYINELKGLADVERQRAFAQADIEKNQAFTDAQSASYEAQVKAKTASAEADLRAANAEQQAVKSLFEARLVQVNSERVRDLTDQYRNDWYQRSTLEQALAAAEASRDDARTSLAKLHDQQAKLQETALKDWDSRLAALRRYDDQPNTTIVQGDLDKPQDGNFQAIQVTEVPTDE